MLLCVVQEHSQTRDIYFFILFFVFSLTPDGGSRRRRVSFSERVPGNKAIRTTWGYLYVLRPRILYIEKLHQIGYVCASSAQFTAAFRTNKVYFAFDYFEFNFLLKYKMYSSACAIESGNRY